MPRADIPPRLYVHSVFDTGEALKWTLEEETGDRLLDIMFNEKPAVYASTDEMFLLQMPEMAEPFPWPFHTVTNSRLMESFDGEADHVLGSAKYVHLVVSAADYILDFLVIELPQVEWRTT